MPGYVEIPQSMMGQALTCLDMQAALLRCNPDFHFDMGVKLNIWHPYQEGKQGVYFRGEHICSMDRGNVPMVPIWSTKTMWMRLPASELSYGEITAKDTMTETEFLVDGTERETGFYHIRRQEKDRLLWLGWQHTLRRVLNKKISGCDKAALEFELGVTIDIHREDIKDLEVAENRTHLYDASGRQVSMN